MFLCARDSSFLLQFCWSGGTSGGGRVSAVGTEWGERVLDAPTLESVFTEGEAIPPHVPSVFENINQLG